MSGRIVLALGGNAILQAGQKGTIEEQRKNVYTACLAVADLIAAGYEVIVTHGNGPQVGAVLLQNEAARDVTPAMPLDVCGAATQGQLGYMMQQTLANILAERGDARSVVSLVTQVKVDAADPAFQNPTKPIGSFYSENDAQRFMSEKGWAMKEDRARGGWRRVVASPSPIAIIEKEAIRQLIQCGTVIIASGGGGIPVVEVNGVLSGIEAVIDKDLAGERLARDVDATMLMILTDVPRVALNYGTPEQVDLGQLSLSQVQAYYQEGHFKAGSMGPKVMAAIRFVESGGERAIITSLESAAAAVAGTAGTVITRS